MAITPSKSSVEVVQVAPILPVPQEPEEAEVEPMPNPSISPLLQVHRSTIKSAKVVSPLQSMAQIPFSIALQGLPGLVPIPLVLVPKVEQVPQVPQVLQAVLLLHLLLQVQVTSKTMEELVAQEILPPTQVVEAEEQEVQMEPEEQVVPAIMTIQLMV
jgi:hypothetical protein